MHFIAILTFFTFQPPIVVDLPCPEVTARTIATEVAPLLEEAAKKLPGVEQVATTSTPGQCRLFVDLKPDADRAKTRSQLAEHLKAAKWPALAKESTFRLLPEIDADAELLLLQSDGRYDVFHLSALAEHLRADLARLPGVAEVTTTGGRGRIVCHLDLDRLARFNLSVRDVADGLREALAKETGQGGTPALTALANLEDKVLATKAGQAVRLRDVARVELGRQGMALAGFLAAGSSPAEMPATVLWLRPRLGQAEAVRKALVAALPDLKKKLPEGIVLTPGSLPAGQTVVRLRLPDGASEERRIEQARQVAQALASDPLSGGVLWINEQPETLVVPWPAKGGTKLDLSSLRRRLAGFQTCQPLLATGYPFVARLGAGANLRVHLLGTTAADLAVAREQVRTQLASQTGVVDLRVEPGPPLSELHFVPDVAKAKVMGLTVADLDFYQQVARGPLRVATLRMGNAATDVELLISGLNLPENLAQLHLPNQQGERIPWATVFATRHVAVAPLVYRVNGQECHVLSMNLTGTTRAQVEAELNKLKLPTGVRMAIQSTERGR